MSSILKTINDGIKLAGMSVVLFILALVYGLFMFSDLALNILIDGASLKNLIVFGAVIGSLVLSGLIGMLARNTVDLLKSFAKSLIDSYKSSNDSGSELAQQGG